MALENLIYDKGWIQKMVGWIELTWVGGFSGGGYGREWVGSRILMLGPWLDGV